MTNRHKPSRIRKPPALEAGKTRITIRIDNDVLEWFRREAGSGRGYQSLLNQSLRDYIAREPLESTLRRVIREELARIAGRQASISYDAEPLPLARVADADDTDDAAEYGASLKRRRGRKRQRN